METLFWIWMAAALVFLMIEIGVPGLIFICFAAGSVCAAIYAQFNPENYLYQTGIFAIITILLIPLTRRFAKRVTSSSETGTNIDALLGQPAIIVKEVNPEEGLGQARIQGEIWSATAQEKIPVGAKVTVTGIDGNKLVVTRGITAPVTPDSATKKEM